MFRFVYFIAVTLLGSVVFLSAPLSATPAIHHLPTDTLHADALGTRRNYVCINSGLTLSIS